MSTAAMGATAPPAAEADSPARARLRRLRDGRVLGGVATGLAAHLGVPLPAVRVVLVALLLAGGWPVVGLYAALWVLAPTADGPPADVQPGGEAAQALRETGYLLSLAALAAGGVLLVGRSGLDVPERVTWPLAVVGFGVVILWRLADDTTLPGWRRTAAGARRAGVVRAGTGIGVVVVGLAALAGSRGRAGSVLWLPLAVLVIVTGLALVSAPWWLRMARDLDAERSARIREQGRAEVAAHVHDSVLHTLALIQRHLEDPQEVARLARAQERDLRTWLYRPVPVDASDRFAAALAAVVAEVEDAHGLAVDTVVVGDAPLGEGLHALLLAAREALVNAARHAGGGPVSVYAEVETDRVSVFVRDRGPGFVLDAVPPDRLGVRQSIIGRMQRSAGRAVVRTGPGAGTEVELVAPLGGDGA